MSHEFWKRIVAYWKHIDTLEVRKEREKKVEDILKQSSNKPYEVKSILDTLDEDDWDDDEL